MSSQYLNKADGFSNLTWDEANLAETDLGKDSLMFVLPFYPLVVLSISG